MKNWRDGRLGSPGGNVGHAAVRNQIWDVCRVALWPQTLKKHRPGDPQANWRMTLRDAGQEAGRWAGVKLFTAHRRDVFVSLPAAHLGAAHRQSPEPQLETLYRYEEIQSAGFSSKGTVTCFRRSDSFLKNKTQNLHKNKRDFFLWDWINKGLSLFFIYYYWQTLCWKLCCILTGSFNSWLACSSCSVVLKILDRPPNTSSHQTGVGLGGSRNDGKHEDNVCSVVTV